MTTVQDIRGRSPSDVLGGPESALRRRAAELEAIFDALADGLLIVDTTGQVVEANASMLAQLGLSRKEQALGPLVQLVHGRTTRLDGSPPRADDLAGYLVLRSGQITRGELRVAGSNRGHSGRVLETVATPIRDPDGAILGAAIVSRDVTARNRRERDAELACAVADVLERGTDLTAALEAVADRCVPVLADWLSIYLTGPNDGLLRPAIVRHREPSLLAPPSGVLDNRPLRPGEGFAGAAAGAGQPLLLPQLTDDVLRRYATSARESQTVRRLRLQSVVAVGVSDGQGLGGALVLGATDDRRPFDAQDAKLVERLARLIGSALVRARHFEELTEALDRWELVLAALPDGLLVVGDRRVVLANPAAGRLLGLAQNPTGWSIEEVARAAAPAIPELERPDQLVRHLDSDRSDVSQLNLRLMRPAAKELQLVAAPVSDKHDAVVGRVVMLHDLTDVRAMERVKDEYAARIGRELRAPLAAVSAYAVQALRRERQAGGDSSVLHSLEVILRNARHLAGLVGDLSDAARVEQSGLELTPTDVDVLALVEQAADQARAMTTIHRLRLDAPATMPPARWDSDRVRQTLLHVLGNAITYWPEGGQIGLRVRPRADGALISIRDRGIGIPPDQLEHVFERFFRVRDGNDQPRPHGAGLGLHLVAGVVRAHKGAVWAESSGVPGEGTVVHLVLPWRMPADEETRGRVPATGARRARRARR